MMGGGIIYISLSICIIIEECDELRRLLGGGVQLLGFKSAGPTMAFLLWRS